MNPQRGQAMVEFAVVVGVFVLLTLGTELLARYHDIQRQALLAARQQAFSATWLGGRVSAATLQDRARELFFEKPGWSDPTGSVAVPAEQDAIRLAVSEGNAPGRAAAAIAVALQPLRAVGGFLSPGFDLSDQGFQHAQVSVTLAAIPALPAPFDTLALDFVEQAAVLGDAWNASGPGQVAARSRGLVPTSLLASTAAWLRPALAPLTLLDPALSRFCPGLLEPDLIPVDRLAAAAPGAPQPGQAGCR
jgi:hypothetical protein